METHSGHGAAQPPYEQHKSFDPVASVNLLRFDLITQGSIHPETWSRVRDEELTYMAEGMNRPLHTEFGLRRMSGELVYFDSGAWRPYSATLVKGLATARAEAALDGRTQFQVERAADDLAVGYKLQGLRPGQKLCWYSAFPEAELQRHGAGLVQGLGYQPARRMGFIYQAIANPDGGVTLHSQSVDASDGEAFAAAVAAGNAGDITDMRAAYDSVLTRRHRRRFFAGRAADDMDRPDSHENAWELMNRHKDILDYYFAQLGVLAAAEGMPLGQLETAKKRLTYGTWAALKERLDRQAVHAGRSGAWPDAAAGIGAGGTGAIRDEIRYAYQVLAARGEQLFGCGGAISGEEALLAAPPGQVFEAVFGKKQSETLEWVDGYCRIDNCPTAGRKTKVAQCKVCRNCQAVFDKGDDPVRVYKTARRAGHEVVKKSLTDEWFKPKPAALKQEHAQAPQGSSIAAQARFALAA
jgi:hypothetical protein